MKTIKFKPLRRIKKTGKLAVAGYLQWNKILSADYMEFNLEITDNHQEFDENELVYNHKGEQLFFYNYNPADVPVYHYTPMMGEKVVEDWTNGNDFHLQPPYGILWNTDSHVNYNMQGTDCNGVPAFSHYTFNYIGIHCTVNLESFVPLTVGMVNMWYGWILWQLNNVNLNKIEINGKN